MDTKLLCPARKPAFHALKFATALFALLFTAHLSYAQDIRQTVRGQVIDAESHQPLPGATVTIRDASVIAGGITDAEGQFRIVNVPVGRHTIVVTYEGFQPAVLNEVTVNSSKELVLTIPMAEDLSAAKDTAMESSLATVEITAQEEAGKAQNEMSSLSARSFSVEETQRYAAAVFDPARMAQNFAGVVSAGFDMSNEIIIRGNSPRYMLWRLEGIEIPNPNHFGSMGTSGGAISMLSSSTLGQSDFYTGAFPAEFGNATSGVFDLNFRRGNNEQRESAIMIGLLGLEASTEGYFSKKSKASYLFNYRYSTLALLEGFLPSLNGILPAYQDASFHIHLPTKNLGTFGLFGLGGSNKSIHTASADSSQWNTTWDATEYDARQQVGIAGLKHTILLGERSFLRTTLAASTDNYRDESFLLIPEDNYRPDLFDKTIFKNNALRLHSQYQWKMNARHTLRAGVMASQIAYDYRYDRKDHWDKNVWTNFLNSDGQTQLLQAYAQWKTRVGTRWTFNGGLHTTYLTLNQKFTIDPRASISWQAAEKHRISLAGGIHSKPEHISTLMMERKALNGATTLPNRDLDFNRAAHLVMGYDWQLRPDLRLKLEGYYQHLFDMPISLDSGSSAAIVNMPDIWNVLAVQRFGSQGLGRNMGIDLTFEKSFDRGFYFLATGSLFDSRYQDQFGKWHNTRYNNNYVANILGGKEWKLGKADQNTFGINAKATLSGGNRYSALDLQKSIDANAPVEMPGDKYTEQVTDYFRFDAGVRYTINRPKTSHHIMLDLQNVTNRQNVFTQFYDAEAAELKYLYQNGLFPIFNYRVEF